MKQAIRDYLGQYLKCPIGKKSVKDDTTYIIEHVFVQDIPVDKQKVIIKEYRNFFINLEVKPSLAVVLSWQDLHILEEQKNDIENYRKAVNDYQEKLINYLADVILRTDMAGKNLSHTEDRSKQNLTALPWIWLMPIWSGWWMTVDRFYKNLQGGFFRHSSAATSIRIEWWESLLVFYMWPIYEKEHPRYSPQHLIILNNFADIDKVGDRWEIMKIIKKNFQEKYDRPFFATPIPEDYTKKSEDDKKRMKSIFNFTTSLFKK